MSSPELQAAKRSAPRYDRFHQCDVTTASGSVPYTSMTNIDTSKIVILQAAGGDVSIVCGPAGKTIVAGSAADTTSNLPGFLITDGSAQEFWFAGDTADRLYTLGSTTCKLNIWESSDVK